MKRGSTNQTEVASRRILIVDDHPIVRQGLVALIAQQTGLEVLGEAANVAVHRWSVVPLIQSPYD